MIDFNNAGVQIPLAGVIDLWLPIFGILGAGIRSDGAIVARMLRIKHAMWKTPVAGSYSVLTPVVMLFQVSLVPADSVSIDVVLDGFTTDCSPWQGRTKRSMISS